MLTHLFRGFRSAVFETVLKALFGLADAKALLRQGYGGHPSPLSRMAAPSLAHKERWMVGPDGLEPSTPRLSSACSNQLSYEPKIGKWTNHLGFEELVEPAGLEPATSCLQSRCSTN